MSGPAMNTAFSDQHQWAWDSTSLSLFDTCPRKYQLRMIEGWTRRDKSVHLLFGGWYASALEHFYKYRAEGDDVDRALLRVVREALVATWEVKLLLADEFDNLTEHRNFLDQIPEASRPDYAKDGAPWVSDHPAKTRENLIRSIIWYVDQFGHEDIHVLKLEDDRPAVELSFRFELSDGLILCGHLDRVVEYNGQLFVMDQKTTGSTITTRFFDSFSPDIQMSLYTLAGQVVFNMLVKGVIIDASQIAVGFTRFERGMIFRSQTELDEFLHDVRTIIDTAHRCADANYWPKRTASCGNYGGCEFRSICSRSPAVREQFLKGDFVKGETWNPLRTR